MSQWGHLHAFQFLAGKFKFSQLFCVSTTEIPLTTIHPFIHFLVGTESRDAKMMKKKSCFKRPCLNGGTCMHFSGRCACLPGFKGRRCQRTQAKRK